MEYDKELNTMPEELATDIKIHIINEDKNKYALSNTMQVTENNQPIYIHRPAKNKIHINISEYDLNLYNDDFFLWVFPIRKGEVFETQMNKQQ